MRQYKLVTYARRIIQRNICPQPDSVGKIVDPIIIRQLAMQTCSVDNITIMRSQVMQLNGIRAVTWANIRETETSRSSVSLINNMLFGLQMVKATCDVIMDVAGEFVPAAAGISTVYSGVQPNAENLGKFAAGQNVRAADLAKGINAGLRATVKQRLGVDAPLADLADLKKVKADLVINATALDEKALVRSLVDYGVVLGSWITKAAGKAALPRLSRRPTKFARPVLLTIPPSRSGTMAIWTQRSKPGLRCRNGN